MKNKILIVLVLGSVISIQAGVVKRLLAGACCGIAVSELYSMYTDAQKLESIGVMTADEMYQYVCDQSKNLYGAASRVKEVSDVPPILRQVRGLGVHGMACAIAHAKSDKQDERS